MIEAGCRVAGASLACSTHAFGAGPVGGSTPRPTGPMRLACATLDAERAGLDPAGSDEVCVSVRRVGVVATNDAQECPRLAAMRHRLDDGGRRRADLRGLRR